MPVARSWTTRPKSPEGRATTFVPPRGRRSRSGCVRWATHGRVRSIKATPTGAMARRREEKDIVEISAGERRNDPAQKPTARESRRSCAGTMLDEAPERCMTTASGTMLVRHDRLGGGAGRSRSTTWKRQFVRPPPSQGACRFERRPIPGSRRPGAVANVGPGCRTRLPTPCQGRTPSGVPRKSVAWPTDGHRSARSSERPPGAVDAGSSSACRAFLQGDRRAPGGSPAAEGLGVLPSRAESPSARARARAPESRVRIVRWKTRVPGKGPMRRHENASHSPRDRAGVVPPGMATCHEPRPRLRTACHPIPGSATSYRDAARCVPAAGGVAGERKRRRLRPKDEHRTMAKDATSKDFDHGGFWNAYSSRWEKEGDGQWTPKPGAVLGAEWGDDAQAVAIVERYVKPYLAPGGRVLEIGPGGGKFSRLLDRLAGDLILADIAKGMLERTAASLPRRPRTLLLDGSSLAPEADSTIDFVFSYDVFIHLESEEIFRYFAEANRVLVPRGHFLVHTSTLESAFGFHAYFRQLRDHQRDIGHRYGGRMYPLTMSVFRRFAEHSGFEIVDQHGDFSDRDLVLLLRKTHPAWAWRFATVPEPWRATRSASASADSRDGYCSRCCRRRPRRPARPRRYGRRGLRGPARNCPSTPARRSRSASRSWPGPASRISTTRAARRRPASSPASRSPRASESPSGG